MFLRGVPEKVLYKYLVMVMVMVMNLENYILCNIAYFGGGLSS